MVDVTSEPTPEREQLAGDWSVTSHSAWQLEEGGEAFRCCSAADADRSVQEYRIMSSGCLGCTGSDGHSNGARLAERQQPPLWITRSLVPAGAGAKGQACSCIAGTGWCNETHCWHDHNNVHSCASAGRRWLMARCCCMAGCGQQYTVPQPPPVGQMAAAAALIMAMAAVAAEAAA